MTPDRTIDMLLKLKKDAYGTTKESQDIRDGCDMAIEALQKQSDECAFMGSDRRTIYTDCIDDCIHYNGDACIYNDTCLRLSIDYYQRRNEE